MCCMIYSTQFVLLQFSIANSQHLDLIYFENNYIALFKRGTRLIKVSKMSHAVSLWQDICDHINEGVGLVLFQKYMKLLRFIVIIYSLLFIKHTCAVLKVSFPLYKAAESILACYEYSGATHITGDLLLDLLGVFVGVPKLLKCIYRWGIWSWRNTHLIFSI